MLGAGLGYVIYGGPPVIIGAIVGSRTAENRAVGLLLGSGLGLAVAYGIIHTINERARKAKEEDNARWKNRLANSNRFLK